MTLSKKWVVFSVFLSLVGSLWGHGPVLWFSVALILLVALSLWQRDTSRYRAKNFWLLENLKNEKLPLFNEEKYNAFWRLNDLSKTRNVMVWEGYAVEFYNPDGGGIKSKKIKKEIKILKKQCQKDWFGSEDQKTRRKIIALRKKVISAIDSLAAYDREIKSFEKTEKPKWEKAKKFIPLKILSVGKEIRKPGVPQEIKNCFEKAIKKWRILKTDTKRDGLSPLTWPKAQNIISDLDKIKKETAASIQFAAEARTEGPKLLEELKHGIKVLALAEKKMDADPRMDNDCSKLTTRHLREAFQAVVERTEKKNTDWVDVYPLLLRSVQSYRGMVERVKTSAPTDPKPCAS